jgi:hypothetical protein
MNKLAFYKTNEDLEDEDIGYNAALYSVDIYDKEYIIALGRERKLDAKKNTYYFPVYLIHDNTFFKQIGAYEFESDEKSPEKRRKPFLDKDGDIDPKRLGGGDIILYPYANREFFDTSTFAVSKSDIALLEDSYKREQQQQQQQKMGDKMPTESSSMALDDPLELTIPVGNVSESVKKTMEVLKEGVFERETSIRVPAQLVEENKEESVKLKKEFKAAKTNQWIENFMKNNNYDIVETLSNGDCYFDTIRIAFLQIGYKTTIDKLRATVANSADEDLFNSYKTQYNDLIAEKDSMEKEINTLRKDNAELKKRLATATDKQEKDVIRKKMIENNEIYHEKKEFLDRDFKDLMTNFAFMRDIDSLDDLREYMKTSNYWADERAISVLEKELGFKTIVFAEYNYKNGDTHNVLICTPGEPVEPKFYILADYDGSHYRVISYKQKYILTFAEIPYDVKIMVVMKCMERGTSIYNRISAFRNFQTKLGVSVGGGDNDEEEEDDDYHNTVDDGANKARYDPKIQLVFYHKSADGVAPGKAVYEKMPTAKNAEYSDLFLKKNRDWRKKLDDYWPTEFKLDGLLWYSVEHYYQASKFRKMHPEFYKSFSLNGNPDISRDVEMARIAGSKSGAYNGTQLRPANIKVDSDFYGGRYREEREKAVYAKFSQNDDLKKILLSTHDAKLVKYLPKRGTETDQILMKVRKLLRSE